MRIMPPLLTLNFQASAHNDLTKRWEINSPRNRTVPALRPRTSLQREPYPSDNQADPAGVRSEFKELRYAKPPNHSAGHNR